MFKLKNVVSDSAKSLLDSTSKKQNVPNTSILQSHNPFVKDNGELVNKYINYQRVLDNPNVSENAKRFISQATGLAQNTAVETNQSKASGFNGSGNATNTATTGNSLVDTAKQYLGTQYVWGGASPDGFDCSGLMQYTFAQNGVSIPRTSQEQFKVGKAVSAQNLQPGDLVFFRGSDGTNDAPGHVGMYIGNNQYIQAPKTGDVVKISDLSARNDYAGARRIG